MGFYISKWVVVGFLNGFLPLKRSAWLPFGNGPTVPGQVSRRPAEGYYPLAERFLAVTPSVLTV
jgi:hypothetical protein